MRPVKAAVIQAGSTLFNTAATLEKFERLAGEATEGGAGLCIFPEAFIGGYPKGYHFGAPVGSRSPEGRDWFRRYFDSAIDVPGPETARMGAVAADHKLDIVVGVIERAGAQEGGGTLYCCVLCFTRDGALLGKRRKLMPTAAERLIWGFGDGSTLDLFETTSARMSAVICWENYMPMMRMSQYAQGVEIYCAPSVDDRESWTALMRTVAAEGRCFVLSANQFMRRSDAPADFQPVQGDDPKTVLIDGGSVIISPMGDILAGPVFGEETILFADLAPAELARGKMDFDVAGHYARPDIFDLSINRAKQSPVR